MLSNRPLILMVRHGRTELNAQGKLRAWEDVPLDGSGRIDAQLAAGKLASYKPKFIYHSDLMRDTQTAEIISDRLGNIPYEPDYAVRTADVGELSGQDEDEVKPRILRWYQNPWEPAPSGESYQNFTQRFMKFYDEKLELSKLEEFNPIVIVSHGRNIALLHSHYRMIPPEQALMPLAGGIAMIYQRPDESEDMVFLSPTEPVQDDR